MNGLVQFPLRVAVRVRPLLPSEGEAVDPPAVRETGFFATKQYIPRSLPLIPMQYTPTELGIGRKYSFSFDQVFQNIATQHQVFSSLVEPLLDRFIEGYNTSILAYGQTGTGKTFTMGTSIESEEGILPQSIRHVFQKIATLPDHVNLHVSFLEIYNEDIVDLLDINTRNTISLREDSDGHIIVHPLKKKNGYTAEQCMQYLHQGLAVRRTASTCMNSASSRSHAIFTLYMEKTIQNTTILSKCHFVDLAGSERLKKTMSTGDRQRESISINQGLLALSNVIRSLTEETPTSHIPYRDSKLTRLLQDSLGGNSISALIACVSPLERDANETINTLRYASKARLIKNECTINYKHQEEKLPFPSSVSTLIDPKYLEILRENERLMDLNRQLIERLSSQDPNGNTNPSNSQSFTEKEIDFNQDDVAIAVENNNKYDFYVNLCEQYEGWLEEKETQFIRMREERDLWREKCLLEEGEQEERRLRSMEGERMNARLDAELKQLRDMVDQTLAENAILTREQQRLLLELRAKETELVALKCNKENVAPVKILLPSVAPQSPSQMLASKINSMFVKTPVNETKSMTTLLEKTKGMESRLEQLLMKTRRDDRH